MLKQKTRNTCIALLLIVLLCAGMLSACGNDAAPADDAVTASANADGSDRIILRLAVQEDATGGTQSVVDAFNTSQDKYEIVWEKLSNDASEQSTQLLTSLQSSGKYDVLSLDVCWVGEMIAAGYLEPLDMMMPRAGCARPTITPAPWPPPAPTASSTASPSSPIWRCSSSVLTSSAPKPPKS